MQLIKTCSCTVLGSILLPYFIVKRYKNDKNRHLTFYINSTKIIVPYPDSYEKFRNIVGYSTIGAISGMILGNFI